MAQESNYIAVRSEKLSKDGEARYVIKNRETHEVVDNNQGRGYKNPQAAHASFAFKQKHRGWKGGILKGTVKSEK